jgi:hypothetical protein
VSFYGKQVGQFTIGVEEPYPAWVRLSYSGVGGHAEWTINPTELADLEYAVKAAKAELIRMDQLKVE